MAGPIIGGIQTVFGFLSGLWGGTPQDFDVLKRSAFLQWAVDRASSSGIPVLFCWFDAIVKVLPDGAFFSLMVVDNCLEGQAIEERERQKETIWAVRCREPVKVTTRDRSEIERQCSFLLLQKPGIIETITDTFKDLTGFDSTTVQPQPTTATGEQPTVSKAGFQLPGGAGIALAAVGLLLIFAFARGR